MDQTRPVTEALGMLPDSTDPATDAWLLLDWIEQSGCYPDWDRWPEGTEVFVRYTGHGPSGTNPQRLESVR